MAVRSGQSEAPDATELIIPSIYAAQLVQLTERWHVDPARLLDGSGLSEAKLADAQARVSPQQLWRLVEQAIALTREPGLGFYFGLQLKLSSHGSVGFAAMTSATLRAALMIAERYVALRMPALTLRLGVEGDYATITLGDTLSETAARVFATEALFTALVQMSRTVLGRGMHGMFEVSYDEPAYFPGFAHLWDGPVRFGRETSCIRFPASVLDEPLQMSDEVAARQALAECERELSNLHATSSLLAGVRRQLAAGERGFPTLGELASARHVSPRTLKRRLAEQNTSYQKLLDELRRDRALKLLEVRAHTIEEIASALGYSDAANFNRAFRRWLGVSPSRWRSEHVAKG